MSNTYQFYDFLYYPNMVLKISAILNYNWYGSLKTKTVQRRTLKWFATKVLFVVGAMNLIYQNFGLLIYLIAHLTPNSYTAANVEPVNKFVLIGIISETGGVMGLTMVAACKMFIIFWHAKRISKLMEELHEMFPCKRVQHDPNQLYRIHYFATISGKLMKRTTIFSIFALCVYNIVPFLELMYTFYIADMGIIYIYQSNTWYPWHTKENSKTWWNLLLTYLCQLQSSLTGLSFILAGEFMLCFFITQMQIHFDYLCNALLHLDAASAKANDKLKFLIIYHTKLLRFCKEINLIFNISFIISFITSSIAICLMALTMVMLSISHTIKYSVGLLAFLVFNFFICYNGSELTASGDELMSSSFHNNWFEGNLSYRRMILFFMLRASKPNVLRASKFATVSMPTFMALLQLSYKLFTFIRAMG